MRTLVICLLFPTLVACSNWGFPGVYRIDVEQGNIVTQEMVDQLKPGMNRAQVRFILGTPMLEDPFNRDRWDYIYLRRNGTDTRESYDLVVYFDGDVMTRFEGSFEQAAPAMGPAVVETVDEYEEERTQERAEQATEETAEQSDEDSADDRALDNALEGALENADQTSEQSTEDSAEQSAAANAEPAVEESVEENSDENTEENTEQSNEASTEETTEESAEPPPAGSLEEALQQTPY